MIPLAVIAAVAVASAAWLIRAAWLFVAEGFEDNAGFHYGNDPHVPAEFRSIHNWANNL